MRVLFQHRHRPDEVNGVLQHLSALSEELASRGVETSLFSSRGAGVVSRFRAVRQHDLVVLNSNDLLTAIIARILGKPVILTLHYSFYHEPLVATETPTFGVRARNEICVPLRRVVLIERKTWSSRMYNVKMVCGFIGRLAAAATADRVLACSKALADATPLPWSIDVLHPCRRPTHDRTSALKKLESLKDPPTFCFVGNIWHGKGLDILLKAASTVRSSGLQFRMEIIGDGYGDAKQMARNLGLEAVTTFHGKLPHSEVRGILSGCIASVIPSRCFEAFGLVACEAGELATCPIVAQTGGLFEAGGPDALSFPVDDDASLVSLLVYAIQNPQEMLDRGERCRRYVQETLAPARTVERFLDVARTLLTVPRGRPLRGSGSSAQPEDNVGPRSIIPPR